LLFCVKDKAAGEVPQGVNSLAIYEQIFSTKVFFGAFLCIEFGFAIFCQNNIGAKAAGKMLVKLTKEGETLDVDTGLFGGHAYSVTNVVVIQTNDGEDKVRY
jgi:hypothetical protein